MQMCTMWVVCNARRQKDFRARGVQINYFLQASLATAPRDRRCLAMLITRMKLFKGNWIALVIFSTDFRSFDDSTSFSMVRVFRHSPRTTLVGYLRLPERRIDTRTTGCARLIRESKLSCIIHDSPSLFLFPPSLPRSLSPSHSPALASAIFWIGNFWNSLCRFWRENL